jgi:hypothetical protein
LSKASNADNAANSQSNSAGQNKPREVYIQIAREDQRESALELQAVLRKEGYLTPAIDLVPHPTVHPYVRYFDVNGKSNATQIQKLMASIGFPSEVQDFAAGQQPSSAALEVWIGSKEPVRDAQSPQ